MQHPSVPFGDEADLYLYIEVLRRRWKVVALVTLAAVLLAFVAGILVRPVYDARARIIVADGLFPARATSLLMGDGILDLLAERMGGDPLDQRTLSVHIDLRDPALVVLSAQGSTPREAADLANNWADVGTQWIADRALATRQAAVERTMSTLYAAEQGLARFAEENGLESHSWTELATLVGIDISGHPVILEAKEPGWPNPIRVPEVGEEGTAGVPRELAELRAGQRLELSQVLRRRQDAYFDYEQARLALVSTQNGIESDRIVNVIGRAELPRCPIRPRRALYCVVAGLMGLVAGTALAWTSMWWESWEARAQEGDTASGGR